MNGKEAFQRIMNYQKVNRLPVITIEPYEDSVISRWHGEGLPEGQSPVDFLGMDKILSVPLNLYPIPLFERRTIFEDSTCTIETDELGATVKRLKSAPTMYYGYIDHPVKNRDDWEKYKERFCSFSNERKPENMMQEIEKMKCAENITSLCVYPFLFRLGFFTMGMERFMMAFYDTPDLVHDMFSFWCGFVLDNIQGFLKYFKVDYATYAEDLAYKSAPHISPAIYKEFWLPYQDAITNKLIESGIPVISMWSAGNLEALIPLLLEHGINCIFPLERNAGMDPIIMRQKYGRCLKMAGGIPKEALISGPDAIDRELERLMPVIKDGGYIPTIDDMVPPEVSFKNYCYYIEKIKKIRL